MRKELKLILLDAGHGGMINGVYQTAGKRSPKWEDGSQYFEGVGNREIREELAKLLKDAGIRYKYVNEGERDTKLSQRVAFANSLARKYGPGKTLYISIHSDAYDEPNAHGWSCYTSLGETDSDTYAEDLYNRMIEEFPKATLRRDYADGDQDKESKFYVLTQTICPAILSENFFMTNPKECKGILMQKEGRRKIAKAHFEMIKNFYKG